MMLPLYEQVYLYANKATVVRITEDKPIAAGFGNIFYNSTSIGLNRPLISYLYLRLNLNVSKINLIGFVYYPEIIIRIFHL